MALGTEYQWTLSEMDGGWKGESNFLEKALRYRRKSVSLEIRTPGNPYFIEIQGSDPESVV